uniref:Uncharacterized protein n=1 Tax=Anguilla anguilla TaxID=7936 RepID=A0A0E9QYM4_ANGAN
MALSLMFLKSQSLYHITMEMCRLIKLDQSSSSNSLLRSQVVVHHLQSLSEMSSSLTLTLLYCGYLAF